MEIPGCITLQNTRVRGVRICSEPNIEPPVAEGEADHLTCGIAGRGFHTKICRLRYGRQIMVRIGLLSGEESAPGEARQAQKSRAEEG